MECSKTPKTIVMGMTEGISKAYNLTRAFTLAHSFDILNNLLKINWIYYCKSASLLLKQGVYLHHKCCLPQTYVGMCLLVRDGVPVACAHLSAPPDFLGVSSGSAQARVPVLKPEIWYGSFYMKKICDHDSQKRASSQRINLAAVVSFVETCFSSLRWVTIVHVGLQSGIWSMWNGNLGSEMGQGLLNLSRIP